MDRESVSTRDCYHLPTSRSLPAHTKGTRAQRFNSEVAPLSPVTWALVGPPGVAEKTLFLHLGWSSLIGEDGSELGPGTEGRDMFTLVQSFINCLPKGRGAVAWARLRRLQWHPYIHMYSNIPLCAQYIHERRAGNRAVTV